MMRWKSIAMLLIQMFALQAGALTLQTAPLDDTDSDRLVECSGSKPGGSGAPDLVIRRLRETGYTYVRFYKDLRDSAGASIALEDADPRNVLPVDEMARARSEKDGFLAYYIGAPRFFLKIGFGLPPQSADGKEFFRSKVIAVLNPSKGMMMTTGYQCAIAEGTHLPR